MSENNAPEVETPEVVEAESEVLDTDAVVPADEAEGNAEQSDDQQGAADAEESVEVASLEGDPVGEDEDPYAEFRSELRRKPGKWYVVHSYAGFEKRVKQNI